MARQKLHLLLLISLLAILPREGAAINKRGQTPVLVSGCELLNHPARYSGKMVRVKGIFTLGFEREDLTFDCDGGIDLDASLYPSDKKKYGFLTEQSSLDAMNNQFREEHPGDNLTKRENKYASATIVGLFRCHYDFPDCRNISRDGDSSIVMKSVHFEAETHPAVSLR